MKVLLDLWKYLMSERGEVSDSTEGTQDEAGADVTTQDEPQVTDAFEQAAASGQSQDQNTEEQFIDPSALPEELKPHWKRMHREYNKRLSQVKDLKSKAEIYDRFYGDAAFANQVLQEWATRNGYTLSRQGEVKESTTAQAPQAKAPAELVEAFKAQLPPELHWMAEPQAAAFWAAQQKMMAPLQQQRAQAEQAKRNQEYDQLAEELAETAPEWVDKEEEMVQLLEFLSSPDMKHKKYGSKLALLYNIVTGNSAAISEATKRMVQGVKNKNANGNRNIGRSAPNLSDRIKKASTNDAWELAKQAALNGE